MTVPEAKADARLAAFKRRAGADPQAAEEANRHLTRAVREADGRVVSGYWPIRTEIDPRPTLSALSETHDLCLPVVKGPARPLLFRRWRDGAEMVSGNYGTSWPADGEELTPDILIVPLAAFDASGFRLGYGGGFYDRTLEKLRAQGRTTAIGFAYAIQEVPRVPREPTDQPLDLIVTENGIVTPGRAGLSG